MHRLTAKLLFLVIVAGSLVPLAMAITTAPPHACCVRKAVHRCREADSADSSGQIIRDTSCCDHECGRAATTGRWANAQPKLAAFFLQTIHARLAGSQPDSTATASAEFQSSRAPPAC
jgi:hypothetical protein